MKTVYIIGSLANPRVVEVERALREAGFAPHAAWYAAGPEADRYWEKYERARGLNLRQALKAPASVHVVGFDKQHMDRCEVGLLVLPAGKSGHLEVGYMTGKGKDTYVLFDGEPDRWDQMYGLVKDIFYSVDDMLSHFRMVYR